MLEFRKTLFYKKCFIEKTDERNNIIIKIMFLRADTI